MKDQKIKPEKTTDSQSRKRNDFSPYSLRDHFLVSMPNLEDTYFSQSLIYVCDHSGQGALAIVLNRPLEQTVGDVFRELNIPCEKTKQDQNIGAESTSLLTERPVLSGGPINTERGFILHTAEQKWESTLQVSSAISVTASKDILFAIAEGKGPKKSLIALGYAGWSAGQLEEEIAENSWLTLPANNEIIFDVPFEKRWATASTISQL